MKGLGGLLVLFVIGFAVLGPLTEKMGFGAGSKKPPKFKTGGGGAGIGVVIALVLAAMMLGSGSGKNWQVSIPIPGTGNNGGIPASIVQRGYTDCYHTLATNVWNCRKPGGAYVDVKP